MELLAGENRFYRHAVLLTTQAVGEEWYLGSMILTAPCTIKRGKASGLINLSDNQLGGD